MMISVVQFLLSLPSIALATNIIGYVNEHCSGAYGQCSNIGPRVCCNAIQGFQGAQSAAFLRIPNRAQILGYQQNRNGNQCAVIVADFNVGPGSYCLSQPMNFGEYAGLSYYFPASGKADSAESAKEQECVGSARMDRIVLKDGTAFNIEGLSDGMAGELWELAGQGATKSSVPEKFQQFETVQ